MIVAVLWVVLQTVAQVSLLDWLGDRVDAVTAAPRPDPEPRWR